MPEEDESGVANDELSALTPVDEPVSELDAIAAEIDDNTPIPEPKANTKLHMFLQEVSQEEITTLLQTRRKTLGATAFNISVNTEGSYENLLARLSMDYSKEANRTQDILKDIKTPPAVYETKRMHEGKTILANVMTNKVTPGQGLVLSGNEAKAAFAIQSGRVRRVPLYNSGFYIDISQASLDALNTFFTKAHNTTTEYGRQLGGYFFFFHALLVKESLVELIIPLVQGSNLRNWNQEDNLLNALSLLDFKIIVNAVAALMNPNGYNYTHVCANPEGTCHHSEELLIDVNKFNRYDFSKLNIECIKHMARKLEATPESLAHYHKQLGFGGRTIRHDRYELELQVPSLANYLNYGRAFNGELMTDMFINNPNNITRFIQFAFYRIYTPFVAKITLFDAFDDKPNVITSDPEAISEILSQIQNDDKNQDLTKKIDSYIADCEIGKVCYPATPCVSCNYIPSSGYYTVDPELNFFILSLARLSMN